ncbi:proline dehydrogenase 1-like protein [Leptotrombidium deliense]|uniref:Proline dehydrogenase n=1 Tax=Leptotrombidium deliense TaxID=299467 RepID=A0A443SKV7_9ACAR|nr:proline dehydrogenase 1-like protein [Leptotrombidium deliense]
MQTFATRVPLITVFVRVLNNRSFLIVTNQPLRLIERTKITASANEYAKRANFETAKNACSPPQKNPLDFSDTKEAYKSKRTSELVRALIVLKLSSYDFLVVNHSKLIKVGKRVLGTSLFRLLMKYTFYGQFVAGEDEEKIRPVIQHLKSFGVKSILDYSAEEDLSEEQAVTAEMATIDPKDNVTTLISEPLVQYKPQMAFMDRRKFTPVARTYFYLSEAQCEKNMDIFIKCIDSVAGVTAHTGLAAIKLTALGRPKLLLQLSEVIARTKLFFKEVTGVDKMVLGTVTPEEFQAYLDKRFHIKTDNIDVKKWFEKMDYDRRGLMNLFSWNGLIDMQHLISDLFQVPNSKTGKMERIISALTDEEEEMFRNMMRRIHTIARHARDTDVRIMIDAEQSYFQPAINRITLELMRKYNKEKAIIFNTYQCYLKNAYDTLMIDLELARRQNFFFGAKLVRGAYMEQERARANQAGYEDPINATFEATTEMYHKCLTEVMREIVDTGIENKKLAVMVASHNENTVKFAVEKMKDLGIQPGHKVICFGQLYGMCDQISFPLGQSGYSVYKYVPYGPVDEVLPYLSRRASENHGILQKVLKERSLLRKEIFRRLKNGQLFYKPVGNYTPI